MERIFSPWLTDQELQDATRLKQPSSQAKALDRMGIPYRRRPDGTLLVGRAAMEIALTGVKTPSPSSGLNWSRA